MNIKSLIACTIVVASITAPLSTVLAATSTTPATEFLTPVEVEVKVRDYFKDVPVMIEIARCESKFRQYTDSGNVLRGGASGGMIGIFQFFESVHTVPAKNLGFDLATVDGNLGYARHLYEAQGTTPWDPAKDCWDVAPVKAVTTTTDTAKLRQQITLLTKLISLLQKQLAAKRAAN